MKALCLFFLTILASLGQQESTQTEARRFDLNGNSISAGSFADTKVKTGDGEKATRVEYGVDVNGRKVPLSSVEETKQEINGRTLITRIVRRFDQNGLPTSSERIQSEEQKSGKSSSGQTSIYRKDINGNEILDEQSVSKSDGKTGTTDILRRASDGSLVLTERQTSVTEEAEGGASKKSQTVTYRKDNNGNCTNASVQGSGHAQFNVDSLL